MVGRRRVLLRKQLMGVLEIVAALADVALVVLAFVALFAVLKLPPLLREVLAKQSQTIAALNEIRAVTRKLSDG